MNIILYFLHIIQYLYHQNCWLIHFICRYIPLKQWVYEDSQSPNYQKYKVDELPTVIAREVWDYKDFIPYLEWRYGKKIKPVKHRSNSNIPADCSCPRCNAPSEYLYRNNGSKGQFLCKVCGTRFNKHDNQYDHKYLLKCPYCSHSLQKVKTRRHFIIHKCLNASCPYYLHNLKTVDKKHLSEKHGKWRYKLHYIYREFTIDFFDMDLNSLPRNASSLKFSRHNSYIMSLCLTMHVNLGLSLRKTAQALNDLYGIKISHQQVANYARTASLVIKPFVDNYDYETSSVFTADETYIKVRGIKGYIWFIMDAVSRSIIGYQVSDNRGVGPCILTMRMAFRKLKELPKNFRFIADGYSAYPLAAQQFHIKDKEHFSFDITRVIGLTNEDAVSMEFRPFKQMIERLNRTFKASYRVRCGYDNFEGANYNVALWVAYYNFLRPHQHKNYQVLNNVDSLSEAENMPGKWQLLIHLGQLTILELQKSSS